MKIIIKNTPEQQELFLKVIKGDTEAKALLEEYLGAVFEQIINNKKINQIDCDWLCVEEVLLDVPLNIHVRVFNKKIIENYKKKLKSWKTPKNAK